MRNIVIKKGHNIKMLGIPPTDIISHSKPESVALTPAKFRGVKPKLLVKEGDRVKIGDAIFFDKKKPDVKWGSPANGVIKSIQFGNRRTIEKVEITVEGEDSKTFQAFSKNDILTLDREIILNHILDSNLFPIIRQRPFNKTADPTTLPRDIFVSGYNSAPLSVDLSRVISNDKETFQRGLTVLSRLTEGSLFLTLGTPIQFDDTMVQVISGPHPAGNVGIQVHHTKSLKPGDIIWSVNAQHVITLGKLFQTGQYDPRILVTVGGSGASNPQLIETTMGASVKSLVANQSLEKPTRLISGDVFTGDVVGQNDFLGFYDSTLSIINDQVNRSFLGMLSLGSSDTKYSLTNTFLSLSRSSFNFTTSQNGEKRAMVPINAWENVLPMDIYPNPLYRAILAQDIEEMEQLGIWECDDEDFALCSFACPSKIDVGQVIRQGLDLMELEG